ncbi:hypothetical protein [Streptomyces caniscabiei]|uniref:hypothetical protein n=1 Tax=Streptomyces caniscabiei TaxID=2746961 RepID=UPI000765AD4D|nr:hypothetical protein [Streptomyces caniscabiei]
METSGGSGQPRSDSEQAPERAHRDATGTPANQDAPTATVVVTVPSVIPLFDPVPVERSATMPNDLDP